MTFIDDELEYAAPFGLQRDLPLKFRWRMPTSAMAALGLPPRRSPRQDDACNAILTEALLAAERQSWVSYPRRKANYVGRQRYYGASYTYNNVLAAVDITSEAGLVEEDRAVPGLRGRQSRLRATPLLRQLLNDIPVERRLHEVIILKDEQKHPVDYADNRKTRAMRKEVTAINEVMARITVELPDVEMQGRYWVVSGGLLIPNAPGVFRVFNRNSWDCGGRLYGWWQRLSAAERATLRLNGEQVLEPDYAQLHAQIIYSLREIPLVGDAYETGEFPREFGKVAFNIAINAKSRHRGVAAIADELKMDRRTASKLLDAIMQKHEQIADCFCSDMGIKLMRTDSEIMLDAVKRCQARNIPVLPVHDSLVSAAPSAEEAAEIMMEAYAARFPRAGGCTVRIKQNGST